MQQDVFAGIKLDQLSIYSLLFADDAVIFSESAEGLQQALNNFESYCRKWKLKVEKTKIVILKKGGRQQDVEKFKYDDDDDEIEL